MAAKRPAKRKGRKEITTVQETAVGPDPLSEPEPEITPGVPAVPEPADLPPATNSPAIPEPPDSSRDPEPAKKPVTPLRPDISKSHNKTFEVVVFALEKEQFAIDLFDVREVVEYTTITKLPNVPPYVLGIIDLRGEITTIIDLRRRLCLRSSEGTTENARIIVLDTAVTRVKTGVLVDDVTSVSTFDTAQVDTSSAAMNDEDSGILGIIKKKAKVQDRETCELIIWLDIRKIIEDIETG